MPAAYVRVRGTASPGQTLAITDELLLGRELLREYDIADAKVSRRHARLLVTAEGRVWIEDLVAASQAGPPAESDRSTRILDRAPRERTAARPAARPATQVRPKELVSVPAQPVVPAAAVKEAADQKHQAQIAAAPV